MRNLALRTRHGGGNRAAHWCHVRPRFGRGNSGGARCAGGCQDIDLDNRALWPGTAETGEVDTAFGCQFASRRRGAEAGLNQRSRCRRRRSCGRSDWLDKGRRGASGRRGGRSRGLPSSSHGRQHRAHRHSRPGLDQQLLQRPILENLDLDCALLGLDHGDDVAAMDLIAGFPQPFDQRARLHVGAQRRHGELAHRLSVPTLPVRRQRSLRCWAAPPLRGAGHRELVLRRCTPGRADRRGSRKPARQSAP